MKIYKFGTVIYLAILILSVSLFPTLFSEQNEYIFLYLYSTFGLAMNLFKTYKKEIKPDYILLLLTCLALYNLNGIIKYGYIQVTITFFICYFLSRRISSHPFSLQILLAAISFSGILQSAIAIFQYFNYLHSSNAFFKVTGNFDNPGPLGGYITICLLSTISFLFYYKLNKIWIWFLSLSIIIQMIGIILSDSRAAWLSVIIGVLYLLIHYFKWKWTKVIFILIITSVSFSLFSLTIYKPQSAHGRLLVWDICKDLIKEKPIYGHGFATFSQYYMPHQASYIATHPETSDILVSNNQFAFNELIHIWCESGIIAVLAVITIIVLTIKYNYSKKSILFPSFIGYFVFSCFSYPFSVTPLLLILPVLLGVLSTSVPGKYYSLPFSISCSLKVLIFAGILILFSAFQTEYRLKNALYDYYFQEKEEGRKLIEENYSVISHSNEFISQYAKVLYMKEEYELCIPVLKQSIVLYPTTEKYIDLGNCYQILGEYTHAENCYKYASKMIPTLIYPHYCLFLLYQETGREKKAILLAQKIVRMKIKNETQRVMEIKRLLKQYIKNRQIDKQKE